MSKKFKIGIDYGGTKIEGILLDDSGAQIDTLMKKIICQELKQ
jgi:predicted NBD/HSP70 family sugar kinase